MENNITKQELLEHYGARDPKMFLQFDGFEAPGDWYANPETGIAVFGGTTVELMRGSAVRVLIDPSTDRAKVLQILHKLVAWIEDGGLDAVAAPWELDDPFPDDAVEELKTLWRLASDKETA